MEITNATPTAPARRSQAATRTAARRASAAPPADRSRQDVISRSAPETGSTTATARAATSLVRGLGENFGRDSAARPAGETAGRALGRAAGEVAGDVGARVDQAGRQQQNVARRMMAGMFGGQYTTVEGERRHVPDDVSRYVPQGQVGGYEPWRNTSLGPIIGQDGRLDVSRLTPEMFRGLSAEDRRLFMQNMGQVEMPALVTAADGRTGAPSNVNGAMAIRNMMWASGDSTAFAQAWAAAPGPVGNLGQYSPLDPGVLISRGVPANREWVMPPRMAAVLGENFGTVMQEMSANGGGFQQPELQAAGGLVQRYMETTAGEDPARAQESVRTLLRSMNSSGLEMTPDNVGTATGTILGGMQRHFQAIHDSDEARNNALSAALGGLGAGVGVLGPFGALVGAGLSAAGSIVDATAEARDYQPQAYQQRAAIRRQWQNESTRPETWSQDDVGVAIDALETAVNANGMP